MGSQREYVDQHYGNGNADPPSAWIRRPDGRRWERITGFVRDSLFGICQSGCLDEIGSTGITLGEAYVFGLDPVTLYTSSLLQINIVSTLPSLSLDPLGAFSD